MINLLEITVKVKILVQCFDFSTAHHYV